jgi:hypothetical protein
MTRYRSSPLGDLLEVIEPQITAPVKLYFKRGYSLKHYLNWESLKSSQSPTDHRIIGSPDSPGIPALSSPHHPLGIHMCV